MGLATLTPPAAIGLAGQGTVTTSAFTPPDQTLVVLLISSGWSGGSGTVSLSVTDSGGHTWQRPITTTGTSSNGGTAAVAYCYFATSPGSITVSVAFSGFAASGGGRFVDVYLLSGANPNQAGAGTGSANNTTSQIAATCSVTTTVNGSWVLGAVSEPTGTRTWTANANSQISTSFADSTDVCYMGSFAGLFLTGTPGATVFGGSWNTAAQSAVAAFEVLPAPPVLPSKSLIVSKALARSHRY
jgi:hypothetical protein